MSVLNFAADSVNPHWHVPAALQCFGLVLCFENHYPRCTGALSYPLSTPRHLSFRWIRAQTQHFVLYCCRWPA